MVLKSTENCERYLALNTDNTQLTTVNRDGFIPWYIICVYAESVCVVWVQYKYDISTGGRLM